MRPFCLILEILGGARAPPAPPLIEALICTYVRGVFSFLKPGWLRGENVVQVKHFDACTLYFLKNRGGQNHPNHPGNYTSVWAL